VGETSRRRAGPPLLFALFAAGAASCALVLNYGDYEHGAGGGGNGGGTISGSGGGHGCPKCPGESTPCQTVVCDNGGCGFEDKPKGTRFDPSPGDCKAFACDGHGSFSAVDDDQDKPTSANPCTLGACTNGNPTEVPAKSGTACGHGLICDGQGNCTGCSRDDQCPASSACSTYTCEAPKCVEHDADGAACGQGPSCQNGAQKTQDTCSASTCEPGTLTPCDPYACGGTACKTSCAGDGDCSAGSFCAAPNCQPKKALGQPCSGADQCGSGFCASSVCCQSACNDPCLVCNGSGVCVSGNGGSTCAANSCDGNGHGVDVHQCSGGSCQSSLGADCSPYGCSGGACTTSCSSNAQCAPSYKCQGSSCCLPCSSWLQGVGNFNQLCSSLADDVISCACMMCPSECAGTLCQGQPVPPSGNCATCAMGLCGRGTNTPYYACQHEVP
jgi:hypothetical protein